MQIQEKTRSRSVQERSQSNSGEITILCGRDKSLTHRSVMFAALAKGESIIREPLLGADCLSTMSCFRALGVQVEALDAHSIRVRSDGVSGFRQPEQDLDCGNSGTTCRLMTGILAALPGLTTRLIGDASLSQRPMKRVVDPLRRIGAKIEGPEDANYLPLTIRGSVLAPGHHEVDKASAQVKSALLLAGLFIQGTTTVRIPKGSRDHTEIMLRNMGAKLSRSEDDRFEQISLEGPFSLEKQRLTIPVDPSSAAFLAVHGLLRKSGKIILPEVLDNPSRTGFLSVLQRMSQAISSEKNPGKGFVEEVMTLTASGGFSLQGTTIQASEVPQLIDEIPILAVAAAFAQTPSAFHGLEELRVKESNRLEKTAELLSLAGCGVRVEKDSLWIEGGLTEAKSFTYDSLGDHRLAMSAAVMARRSKKPCCILDSECVGVSFPDFYEALERV